MAMFDSEMRYIAVSEHWLSIHGLDGSPVGLRHYDVFPEIPEAWKAVHRRCLAGASESSEGDPFRRTDGRIQWVKWSACPWRDSDGSVGGIILTTEDITARKESEAEAAYLASVVTHSTDAIIAKTLDSVVTAWNPGATKLLGFSAEEMIGQSIARVIPAARLAEEDRILARLRAGEIVEHFETQRVAKDGTVVDVSLSISPIRDAMGAIIGASKIMRDDTGRKRTQRELASMAAILATEHEASPDGILVVDPMGRYLSVNRRFAEIFGIPHELLAARDDAAIRALVWQQVKDADAARVRYLYDHPEESAHDELVLKDGRVLDRLTSPFETSDGKYLGRIWFFRDITERRKAEESVRTSEERFRTLVEEAPDAILLYDFDQDRVVDANKATERLFGVSRDEFLRQEPPGTATPEQPDARRIARSLFMRFYAPEQSDGRPLATAVFEHLERAQAGEEVTFERRIRRLSGEERVCRGTIVRLPSNTHLLRVSFVDVTDQVAAEAQVSEVLLGAVRREEEERQRIARELHDTIGQYLAATVMRLDVLARNAPDASPMKSEIAELKSLTAAVGAEMHRLAWELRPAVLDDLGLEPAIQRFVEEWAQRSGLEFDFHCALTSRRLPPDVETTLYRALQEAVTNIIKHAGARKVGVILKASPRGVVMIIEDDGKGFEPDTIDRGTDRRFGLLGMRERLALIHGSLEIESAPGAGTTLIMRVPIKDSAAA